MNIKPIELREIIKSVSLFELNEPEAVSNVNIIYDDIRGIKINNNNDMSNLFFLDCFFVVK